MTTEVKHLKASETLREYERLLKLNMYMNLLVATIGSRIWRDGAVLCLTMASCFLNLCLHYPLKIYKSVQQDSRNNITLSKIVSETYTAVCSCYFKGNFYSLMRTCPLFSRLVKAAQWWMKGMQKTSTGPVKQFQSIYPAGSASLVVLSFTFFWL